MSLGRTALAAASIALLAGCAPHEHHADKPKLNKAVTSGGSGSTGVVSVHTSGSSGGSSTTGGSGSTGTSGGGGLCAACFADGDCAPGGFCVGDPSSGAGSCTVPCGADASCAQPGAVCFELTDPRGYELGTGCFPESRSCASDAGAATTGSTGSGNPGALCSPCTSDTDCAAGGLCVLDGVAGAFCTAPCGSNSSCAAGDTCYQVGTGGESGCYPTSQTCTGSGTCTGDTWESYAEDFFETNCRSCHSWVSSHYDVKQSAADIASRIRSGQMPPGSTLSAGDVDRIVNYLNCGAP